MSAWLAGAPRAGATVSRERAALLGLGNRGFRPAQRGAGFRLDHESAPAGGESTPSASRKRWTRPAGEKRTET